MTDVKYTTDRKAKWVRNIALAIALIWAGYWTLWCCVMVNGLSEYESFGSVNWIMVSAWALIAWVSSAIAWRWGLAGGLMLICLCLFLPLSWFLSLPNVHQDTCPFELWGLPLQLPVPLLSSAAGILFVVSWGARRTVRLRNSIKKYWWVVAIVALEVVVVVCAWLWEWGWRYFLCSACWWDPQGQCYFVL